MAAPDSFLCGQYRYELSSTSKCPLNFLLFLVACIPEDQQIWYHSLRLSQSVENARLIRF